MMGQSIGGESREVTSDEEDARKIDKIRRGVYALAQLLELCGLALRISRVPAYPENVSARGIKEGRGEG